MNINIFFISVLSSLVMIFFFFKPLSLKQQDFIDVPLFELNQFTLYELDKVGLTTLMRGTNALRYSNRYVVKDMDYTDNSKEYIANMRATNGIYQENILKLDGDITYIREDGLTFTTDKVTYNKNTNIASTDSDYVLFQGDSNRVSGKSLYYNNVLNKIESKYVIAKYKIGEKI